MLLLIRLRYCHNVLCAPLVQRVQSWLAWLPHNKIFWSVATSVVIFIRTFETFQSPDALVLIPDRQVFYIWLRHQGAPIQGFFSFFLLVLIQRCFVVWKWVREEGGEGWGKQKMKKETNGESISVEWQPSAVWWMSEVEFTRQRRAGAQPTSCGSLLTDGW